MLRVYRRHLESCKHRDKGRRWDQCGCPVWCDGFLGTAEIRQSMKTTDLLDAQERVAGWNRRGSMVEERPVKDEPVTIAHACEAFLADAAATSGRGLKGPTLYKYQLLLRRLQEFSASHGLRYVMELDLDRLTQFRNGWPLDKLAAKKTQSRLLAFCGFCLDRTWLPTNPAMKLTKIGKPDPPPTLPFSREEMARMLHVCGANFTGVQTRALILLLRHSGLRIQDAVTLHSDRIRDGKLFLRTQKTKTVVWLPLPPVVLQALETIRGSSKYFFWSGTSNPATCKRYWQRVLGRIYKLAGVQGGHAHRFRDTCAVELLLANVPLERVAVVLGHGSTKVTEKHYSPWVLARQEQLESDIRRTLEEIPGTPEVRGNITLQ